MMIVTVIFSPLCDCDGNIKDIHWFRRLQPMINDDCHIWLFPTVKVTTNNQWWLSQQEEEERLARDWTIDAGACCDLDLEYYQTRGIQFLLSVLSVFIMKHLE